MTHKHPPLTSVRKRRNRKHAEQSDGDCPVVATSSYKRRKRACRSEVRKVQVANLAFASLSGHLFGKVSVLPERPVASIALRANAAEFEPNVVQAAIPAHVLARECDAARIIQRTWRQLRLGSLASFIGAINEAHETEPLMARTEPSLDFERAQNWLTQLHFDANEHFKCVFVDTGCREKAVNERSKMIQHRWELAHTFLPVEH